MLFTQEPLMTDLISFIYNTVRCSCLVPCVLYIKSTHVKPWVLVKWKMAPTLTLVLISHISALLVERNEVQA